MISPLIIKEKGVMKTHADRYLRLAKRHTSVITAGLLKPRCGGRDQTVLGACAMFADSCTASGNNAMRSRLHEPRSTIRSDFDV